MGAWGPGLYSDDYAADLRTTVSTVCRLPLSGDQIVAMLEGIEPSSLEPDDEDHTTFWLVVADQLHRRGIASPAAERALAIIDNGSNIAILAELEMSEADLRKREGALRTLRAKLVEPLSVGPRRVLKSPQPLLVSPGEVFAFPVDARGNVRNPYYPDDAEALDAAGWGCVVVVAAEHALGYLAWYAVVRDLTIERKRPTLERAAVRLRGARTGMGTLSKVHMRRMGWEYLGTMEPPKVGRPDPGDIVEVVASDISLSEALTRWDNVPE